MPLLIVLVLNLISSILNGELFDVIFVGIIIALFSVGTAYLDGGFYRWSVMIKIDERGISNKYILVTWDEMKNYGYVHNAVMCRLMASEWTKNFSTLMLFGDTTQKNFYKLDPKKSVWLVNTRKNIEMLEKYSNGKWNKYN